MNNILTFDEFINEATNPTQKTGMSTGAKIGIGAAALGAGYLAKKWINRDADKMKQQNKKSKDLMKHDYKMAKKTQGATFDKYADMTQKNQNRY